MVVHTPQFTLGDWMIIGSMIFVGVLMVGVTIWHGISDIRRRNYPDEP
jgi:hypothetical protein